MRNEETKKVERMSQLVSPTTGAVTTTAPDDELPIVVPNDTKRDRETEREEVASVTPKKEVPVERKEKKSPKKDSEEQLKKERTKAFNYTSDTYNGGDMDAYKWSQTISEVEIKVVLPEATTGKHVRVDISSDHLKVEILKPERKVGSQYVVLVWRNVLCTSLVCVCVCVIVGCY